MINETTVLIGYCLDDQSIRFSCTLWWLGPTFRCTTDCFLDCEGGWTERPLSLLPDWKALMKHHTPRKIQACVLPIVHFFSSVAYVWVPGAKTTRPIALWNFSPTEVLTSVKLANFWTIGPIWRLDSYHSMIFHLKDKMNENILNLNLYIFIKLLNNRGDCNCLKWHEWCHLTMKQINEMYMGCIP
jgi:hypothetical protein